MILHLSFVTLQIRSALRDLCHHIAQHPPHSHPLTTYSTLLALLCLCASTRCVVSIRHTRLRQHGDCSYVMLTTVTILAKSQWRILQAYNALTLCYLVPDEQHAAYSAIIDGILSSSDLNTISAKAIRRGLQEKVDYDLTPQKSAITDLIMERFDKFSNDPKVAEVVQPAPISNGTAYTSVPKAVEASSPTVSHKRKAVDDDDDDLSDVQDTPPPKKVKKTPRKETDEEIAKRMQAEFNAGVGRSTRGGGITKKKVVVKREKKPKKKSAVKIKSADDSDIDSDSSATKPETKLMNLSPPLQDLLGTSQLSRPQMVKQIWAYVKERDLQDPNDKRHIMCDEKLRAVFKSDKVHMFTMNKILAPQLSTDEIEVSLAGPSHSPERRLCPEFEPHSFLRPDDVCAMPPKCKATRHPCFRPAPHFFRPCVLALQHPASRPALSVVILALSRLYHTSCSRTPPVAAMAAAIKALNAKIRSNPVADYFCSTHFWGPASNFGIPIAAVMDTQKDPEIISGPMTLALCGYSGVFMRYAFAVTPRNYLLFGCHFVNFGSQMTQGYRFVNHWYLGGREQMLSKRAQDGLVQAKGAAEGAVQKVEGVAGDAADKAREVAGKVQEKIAR
nr:mitochondrial pyruvate carrier 1 [Quercus suber]